MSHEMPHSDPNVLSTAIIEQIDAGNSVNRRQVSVWKVEEGDVIPDVLYLSAGRDDKRVLLLQGSASDANPYYPEGDQSWRRLQSIQIVTADLQTGQVMYAAYVNPNGIRKNNVQPDAFGFLADDDMLNTILNGGILTYSTRTENSYSLQENDIQTLARIGREAHDDPQLLQAMVKNLRSREPDARPVDPRQRTVGDRAKSLKHFISRMILG